MTETSTVLKKDVFLGTPAQAEALWQAAHHKLEEDEAYLLRRYLGLPLSKTLEKKYEMMDGSNSKRIWYSALDKLPPVF